MLLCGDASPGGAWAARFALGEAVLNLAPFLATPGVAHTVALPLEDSADEAGRWASGAPTLLHLVVRLQALAPSAAPEPIAAWFEPASPLARERAPRAASDLSASSSENGSRSASPSGGSSYASSAASSEDGEPSLRARRFRLFRRRGEGAAEKRPRSPADAAGTPSKPAWWQWRRREGASTPPAPAAAHAPAAASSHAATGISASASVPLPRLASVAEEAQPLPASPAAARAPYARSGSAPAAMVRTQSEPAA